MDNPYDVVAIVGSLRRDSFTRHLVRSFDALAPAWVSLKPVRYEARRPGSGGQSLPNPRGGSIA